MIDSRQMEVFVGNLVKKVFNLLEAKFKIVVLSSNIEKRKDFFVDPLNHNMCEGGRKVGGVMNDG